MKNNVATHKEEYSEIVVRNVIEYLTQVSKFRKAIEKYEGQDADTQRFFFRGQANIGWDIVPGVFREKFLSKESELIHEAYLRDPSEFGKLNTDFEKLAKLQHYGLPTRLLDVTSNPLVALYFSCQEHQEEKSKEDNTLVYTDGVVLFQRTYSKGYNDLEIAVISYLANRGTENGLTLSGLLDELEDKQIYSKKAAQECRDRNYRSLIELLQHNYFVLSNMNNERLIRQSGLFLLVGKYNIIYQENNVGQSLVQVAASSAKEDFRDIVFRIPHDNKKKILKELDFYNINESSLFPELEHQMTYIKCSSSEQTAVVPGSFSKVDITTSDTKIAPLTTNELSDSELEKIIDVALDAVNPYLRDECKVAIMDNLAVDWYRRDAVLSKIKMALTDALNGYMNSRVEAKHIANLIVNKILEEINSMTANNYTVQKQGE